MRASDDSHFDASGPVGRYWLANGVGFTVCGGNGRKLGVVAHVVVDRRRQGAERLIVRRRGLVRRPRYVAIAPREVESVLPDSRLFVVPVAERGAVSTPRAERASRVREVAGSARTAIQALGRSSRPVVAALDRRIAVGAETTLRVTRRAAGAGADAAVRSAGHARREAPRLAAWLSARARELWLVTLAVLHFLGRSARSGARLLGDLAVLAAVGAVAVWRSAEAALEQQRSAPPEGVRDLQEPDVPEWRRDADAPLARERREAHSARRTRR